VTYAGNHGLTISGPGARFEHPLATAAGRSIAVGGRFLRDPVAPHPEAVVCQNGLSMSLNIGLMKPDGRRAAAAVMSSLEAELRWLRLSCERGYLGWDLVPQVGWTKGDALTHLLSRLPRSMAIAVGDGWADESMFARTHAPGFSIRVGASKASAAEWFVRRPADVGALLAALRRERVPETAS
jgi:trehalose 6-phosphate phosphatase